MSIFGELDRGAAEAQEFQDVAIDLVKFLRKEQKEPKLWNQIMIRVDNLITGAEVVYELMDIVFCPTCGFQKIPIA